ncbi:MAG TPA: serine/threonine dehydratase [Myxococcales bacterium]|nr:serine/threonine dehydratase [Myxococcales bacterium]
MRIEPLVLEGALVRLEPMRPEHAEALARVGLDPQLWEWVPAPVRTPDEMRAYVESALEEQRRGRALPFVVVDRKSGEIVGSTRFANIDRESRRLEIGWTWYAPRFQRTGVNTESKRLLLTHAFETLGANRVELKTDALNARSRAAIARLGAVEEGTFRRHQIVSGGRVRDTVWFSIVDREWPAVKARLARLGAGDSGEAMGPGDIARAEQIIRPWVRRTPVVEVEGADLGGPPGPLVLKLELLQRSGSFKARGAFTNLLLRKVPPAGVVAASGGNHGAAVAFAAQKLSIPARIFVPRISAPAKIERIRQCGATLELVGDRYADALEASERFAAQTGAMQVHAFDQDETLLGTGTLGKELSEQAPQLDVVLAAVGGGGLLAGIAAWYRGSADVVGVEPELAPTLSAALAAGKPVDAPAGGIAADSLAPRRVGERVFPIARRFVKEVVLVSDEMIAQAQRALWDALRIAAEPGGAAALAALLSGRYRPLEGQRVGVVISGGNTARP